MTVVRVFAETASYMVFFWTFYNKCLGSPLKGGSLGAPKQSAHIVCGADVSMQGTRVLLQSHGWTREEKKNKQKPNQLNSKKIVTHPPATPVFLVPDIVLERYGAARSSLCTQRIKSELLAERVAAGLISAASCMYIAEIWGGREGSVFFTWSQKRKEMKMNEITCCRSMGKTAPPVRYGNCRVKEYRDFRPCVQFD